MAGKILVTDDEAPLRRTLYHTLGALGFEVGEASNAEQALEAIKKEPFDVVLLDVNMPGIGGIEGCRKLREQAPSLQILMLTIRDHEEDKVQALDAGADDYITKPFSLPELAARIRAAMRRVSSSQSKLAMLVIGDIELDAERRTVRKAGESLQLTRKEFDLLHYLMTHAGVPLTHARLLQAVWGPEHGGELEYLRTFIYHLRKKLEDNPNSPQYLLTAPCLGYRFREPDDKHFRSAEGLQPERKPEAHTP